MAGGVAATGLQPRPLQHLQPLQACAVPPGPAGHSGDSLMYLFNLACVLDFILIKIHEKNMKKERPHSYVSFEIFSKPCTFLNDNLPLLS